VISTTHTTVEGVEVIVKLLSLVEVVFVSVKKFVEDPSGWAFTSIVTPDGGITELIETVNGNVGPTAGASVVPLPGVVVTESVVSVVQLSVFFFLQKGIDINTTKTANKGNTLFFIGICFSDFERRTTVII